MALPSKDELAILDTFRQNVSDILSTEELEDDMFLLRWLRARDYNMDKAEAMLRNAKKWRENNNVDKIKPGQYSDPYFPETFPVYIDGIDKEGRPFVTAPFGKWDVRKIFRNGKSEGFVVYLTERFEEAMHAMKKADQLHRERNGNGDEKSEKTPITQVSGILDWDGFAWGQLFSYQCVQTFLQIASIYEQYYPEGLYEAYFVNCPALITAVMALLKPILAPKTMGKIKCFGTDRKEWVEEMLKRVDESQIRPQFGGTRKEDEANLFLEN